MIQSLADELQKVEEQKIETRMNTDLAKMKVEKGQAVLQVRDEWLTKMTKQAEILKEEKRRKSVPEKGEEIDEEDKISLIMVGEVADEEAADAKKMEEEEKDENVED